MQVFTFEADGKYAESALLIIAAEDADQAYTMGEAILQKDYNARCHLQLL